MGAWQIRFSKVFRIAGSMVIAFAVCLAVTSQSSLARSYHPQAESSSSAPPEQGLLLVKLVRPLNSGNVKKRAMVQAIVYVERNGMTIPRGSLVTGRVTEAKARAKGDAASVLSIMFDKITPPGGAEPVKIDAVIVAVAPDPDFVAQNASGIDYPNLQQSVAVYSAPQPDGTSVPLLNEQSKGVYGFRDLELQSAGVLTSGAKEVKLERGTQLLLSVKML